MKRYLKKYTLFNFGLNFRKITILITKSAALAVKLYIAYQMKGVDVLRNNFEDFRRNF